LLADGQDPDALEARLAYHLHRLGLTGEALREALKGKAYLATALSQGRASIDQDFITTLATSLNIAADELSRAPNETEAREWGFYRTSARNPQEVWRRASELWISKGISNTRAAAIIGMKQPNVARALNGKPVDIFDWHHAQRLSDAIDITPPEHFLPPEQHDQTENPSR
jgi:hypothetical protein